MTTLDEYYNTISNKSDLQTMDVRELENRYYAWEENISISAQLQHFQASSSIVHIGIVQQSAPLPLKSIITKEMAIAWCKIVILIQRRTPTHCQVSLLRKNMDNTFDIASQSEGAKPHKLKEKAPANIWMSWGIDPGKA